MRFFQFNKNLPFILTTLLVIISLGAVYFFIYLPHNEKSLQEQRFRALQNIDRNVHAKIDNSIALLKNLLYSYQENLGRKKDIVVVNNYIGRYPKKEFVLTPVKPVSHKVSKDSLDEDYAINVNNNTRQITLSFRKSLSGSAKEPIAHDIGMKYSFEQFIEGLLPENVFDHYIIFSNEKPVYETFPAGVNQVREDSLLGARTGMKASGIRDYKISGKDYKLFLQPVSFTSDKDWIICGLLSSHRYQNEKSQLPSDVVLLLLTVAIGILLVFPIVKLFQMGNKDRLTVADGIWSIITSMLLMSLLFFSFFKYNLSFRPAVRPDSKKVLSDTILRAVNLEIETAYNTLVSFDKLSLSGDFLRESNIIELAKAPRRYSNLQPGKNLGKKLNNQQAEQLKDLQKNLSLKQVFWLDSNGKELKNWTIDTIIAPPGNFSGRDYFKRIREKRSFFLGDRLSDEFFLDQVISWTTGEFTTILSIPSKGNNVAAMSFKMKSLENTLLPPGYQFAMVDADGKVLYHSRSTRNLNENLLNEFSKSENLSAALLARDVFTFQTGYYSKQYDVRVSPLTGLPYFLVILEHSGYKDTRQIEIYSFTFSMLLLFFIFIIIELLVIFFISVKRSFLKKRFFDTAWIGPKKSSHTEYVIAALFNIIVIVFLVLFFSDASFLCYLFILLFSVLGVSLFLNTLFAVKYSNPKNNKYYYKIKAIWCLLILIAFIDIIAAIKLVGENTFKLFVYEISVLASGAVLLVINSWYGDKLIQVKSYNRFSEMKRSYNVYSFSFMTLTRLIITSGIPVVFFYVASYNYEQNIAVRYKQSDFAKQLAQRTADTSIGKLNRLLDSSRMYNDTPSVKNLAPYSKDSITNRSHYVQNDSTQSKPSDSAKHLAQISGDPSSGELFLVWDISGMYNDSASIKDVSQYGKDSIPYIAYSEEDKLSLGILRSARFFATDEAIAEQNFYGAYAYDSSLVYNHLLKEACESGGGTTTYAKSHFPGQYFKITSSDLNYNLPDLFRKGNVLNGIGFWIFLLFCLAIFHFIIYFITTKLFGLGVPNLKKSHEVDAKLLEDQKLNKLVFVIGSPGARKKYHILQMIKDHKIKSPGNQDLTYDSYIENNNNVFIADMIHIPDSGSEKEEHEPWLEYTEKVFAPKNSLIIVNHFEYNIQDPVSNRIKLNFLEKLMIDDTRKIIILSTIHPVAFLDSAFVESIKQKAVSNGIGDNTGLLDQDLERWHVLLGHYRIVLMPLDHDPESEAENQLEKMICEETKWGYFLNQMRDTAIKAERDILEKLKEEDHPLSPDELALKLQVTSHYFYMYIWQSLTREEKFLLYDLAEDNLVNSFDDYNLSMLVGKGIINWEDGTLELFNKGFRNFILTAIGNTEAMKIKDLIKDNGNWGKLRIPLILIIVAILAFLLASQEEAYTTLITYLAALTAGVPAVLKIFSLFEKTPKPSSH